MRQNNCKRSDRPDYDPPWMRSEEEGVKGFDLHDLTEPNRGYHYAPPVPAPSIFSFIHPFPLR